MTPMARLARVVIPGITQRGNGRRRSFFEDADYELYRDLLAESARRAEVWAWCRMPIFGFGRPSISVDPGLNPGSQVEYGREGLWLT